VTVFFWLALLSADNKLLVIGTEPRGVSVSYFAY